MTLPVGIGPRYHDHVILGFKDKDASALFDREAPKGIPSTIQRVALRKLTVIDAATSLKDLAAIPGNGLEALGGDRKGQHSIRVNDQYRVCFVWDETARGARDVEIVDYH